MARRAGRGGGLSEYERRRDLAATPEPGARRGRRRRAAKPRFVVQEHSARRLHWDLRLERDGVAVSWAIPNGVPDDPGENRKAVHTEDHPLEYLDFEGEIPAGQYGAGTMRIWDRGTYECHEWEEGKVVVELAGERLRGRYALFRAGREERDWMIHRMDPPQRRRDPFPEPLRPMLAERGELPRGGARGRAVEIAWDGLRAIAHCRPGRLALRDADGEEIGSLFPEARGLIRQLGAREAVLDGELVALDADGRPDGERLAARRRGPASSARRRAAERPVVFQLYDLLYLDGSDLRGEPYRERRRLLEGLELAGAGWQTPSTASGRARELLAAAAERGLPGIVLKRLASPYSDGRRSRDWLEVRAG